MKRIVAFIFSVLAVLFMNMPFSGRAEAAYVAVIPIDINVDQVERATDFNGYYWDIMVDRFKYPEYELLDDEKVAAVIPEEGLKSYDKETLAKIADQVGAQIVVAMSLDKVKEYPKTFMREPAVECFMQGQLATLNTITDKYYYKKIYYKDQMEEVLTLRTDWQQNAFADFLRRGINRTLEDNKKKVKFN